MSSRHILGEVSRYYTGKLKEHGTTAKGVDWNSAQSQELRFSQLLKVCEGDQKYSLIDFGCGYGHLYSYMKEKGFDFTKYLGVDVSTAMVKAGRDFHKGANDCGFEKARKKISSSDYSIASGIFNVRVGTTKPEWKAYILETLATLRKISRKGFAFNCLTKYSDRDRMRTDLYYADPCFLFNYCKLNFSKNVALLHDYGLYEFTILVKPEN